VFQRATRIRACELALRDRLQSKRSTARLGIQPAVLGMSLQFLRAAAFARFMRHRVLGSQELACSALTCEMFELPHFHYREEQARGTRCRAR
jgi:hypothetical protein